MGTFEHQPFEIYNERPVKLAGGFVLRGRTADVSKAKKATPQQWQAAFEYALATEESVALWVGDLWNWAQENIRPKELIPQLLAEIGVDVAVKTLYNRGSVARHVGQKARDLAPSFAHLRVVASLPEDEQVALLERAAIEGLDEVQLIAAKRQRKRAAVLSGRAVMAGMYRVFYVDCPWKFRNKQVSGSSANDHYPPMEISELCELPVAAHAEENAVMFFWVPCAMMYDHPGPEDVWRAWGFEYKTNIVWDKVLHNHSHYVSARHEMLYILTRGSCTPDDTTALPDSVQTVRRDTDFEHSEKPEEFRRIIEKCYTAGPYVELFGRKPVNGWDIFGNDARLWAGRQERAS